MVEEGLDPAVVPADQRPLADFGELDRQLDAAALSAVGFGQNDSHCEV